LLQCTIAFTKFDHLYLAAALNPTEIMNAHPEMVMLETRTEAHQID
jgi:hypothetical protein